MKNLSKGFLSILSNGLDSRARELALVIGASIYVYHLCIIYYMLVLLIFLLLISVCAIPSERRMVLESGVGVSLSRPYHCRRTTRSATADSAVSGLRCVRVCTSERTMTPRTALRSGARHSLAHTQQQIGARAASHCSAARYRSVAADRHHARHYRLGARSPHSLWHCISRSHFNSASASFHCKSAHQRTANCKGEMNDSGNCRSLHATWASGATSIRKLLYHFFIIGVVVVVVVIILSIKLA